MQNVIAAGMLCLILIFSPSIKAMISPSGGEVQGGYRANTMVTITWDNALGASYVDVGIWDGDLGLLNIVGHRISSQSGMFNMIIPTTIGTGTHYRFMVRDADVQHRAEFSAGFLRIDPPTLSVLAKTTERTKQSIISENVVCSPLPANDYVEIGWREIAVERIELRDASERIVNSQQVGADDTSLVINLTACASGVYTARLFTSDGNVAVKNVLVTR